MTETKPKITYRGWPGHFICGERCVFHLNTLIEFKGVKIVVSTVGNFKPRSDGPSDNTVDSIGAFDRYFETMAFHAVKDAEFYDMNVSKEVSFDSPWSWGKEEEWKANKGHWVVVEEIAHKMKTAKGRKLL